MIPGSRYVYAILGKFLMYRYDEFIPSKPSSILIPAKWVDQSKRGRVYLGLYEKNESALVNKYLDPNIDTIELGCGVGVVSSHICRKLNPSSRYVGIEGNPNLVTYASTNMERFQASVAREIENGIVTGTFSEKRMKKFYITKNDFQVSSGENENNGNQSTVSVPEKTLSDLIERHRYSEYQLVSDVEGAESEILRDDAESLTHCKRIIIELHNCDFNGTNVTVSGLHEKIQSLGFKYLESRGNVYAYEKKT